MVDKQRTKLVEQRATNAQTIAFVADQEATIVDQAEALAKERPEYTEFADRVRRHQRALQAKRDQELLLHVAGTEAEAGKGLSGCEDEAEGNWVPGTCISGAAVASGMGIGPAMAMMEEAQAPHPETGEHRLA